MSSQRGNLQRSRPQKYQNTTAFKNNLHDKTPQIKMINKIKPGGCCERCKEIIEWKIKYKKFKPLTVPKKCVKCGEKCVKKAYCIMCQQCAQQLNLCMKCGKTDEIAVPFEKNEKEKMQSQSLLEMELKFLPERKKRSILRNQAAGKQNGDKESGATCGSKCQVSDSSGIEDDDDEIDGDILSSDDSEHQRDCCDDDSDDDIDQSDLDPKVKNINSNPNDNTQPSHDIHGDESQLHTVNCMQENMLAPPDDSRSNSDSSETRIAIDGLKLSDS